MRTLCFSDEVSVKYLVNCGGLKRSHHLNLSSHLFLLSKMTNVFLLVHAHLTVSCPSVWVTSVIPHMLLTDWYLRIGGSRLLSVLKLRCFLYMNCLGKMTLWGTEGVFWKSSQLTAADGKRLCCCEWQRRKGRPSFHFHPYYYETVCVCVCVWKRLCANTSATRLKARPPLLFHTLNKLWLFCAAASGQDSGSRRGHCDEIMRGGSGFGSGVLTASMDKNRITHVEFKLIDGVLWVQDRAWRFMSFLSCCPDMKSQAGRWISEGELVEDAAARLVLVLTDNITSLSSELLFAGSLSDF